MVKQLLLATGAYLLLPACKENKDRSTVELKTLKIDGDQEALVAELAETILPKTTTPGAKDLHAPLYILLMLDDCAKEEDQKKFVRGLKDFTRAAKDKLGKDFMDASLEERTRFVTAEDQKKDDSDQHLFYATVKRYTVQAYTTSQFFLTNVQKYELVPGRYHGCIPLKPASTTTL